MSIKYNEYLSEHCTNVKKALLWMLDHQIITENQFYTEKGHSLMDLIERHDQSKYSEEEYDAYDDYFYGSENMDVDDKAVVKAAFDYAWLHHIHRNLHHWQHWVLIGDDEGPRALFMPEEYVYEMIADWWSFSWKNEKLDEVFKWYDEHKERMILHPKTQKLVEDTLQKIRDILEETKKEENEKDEAQEDA